MPGELRRPYFAMPAACLEDADRNSKPEPFDWASGHHTLTQISRRKSVVVIE
jgi:hypothetical protein